MYMLQRFTPRQLSNVGKIRSTQYTVLELGLHAPEKDSKRAGDPIIAATLLVKWDIILASNVGNF